MVAAQRSPKQEAADRRNQKGARQGGHEHDSVTPGVEIDPLAEFATHARGFAAQEPGPAAVSPGSNAVPGAGGVVAFLLWLV